MVIKIFRYINSLIQKMNERQILRKARDIWQRHAIEYEGKRCVVYRDSLGKPTVGIGHLILPKDKLSVGDRISEDRIQELFHADSLKAMLLAEKQAKQCDKYTPEFIAALTSVNFQLGDWTKVFTSSWPLLKNGDSMRVITNLKRSKWNKQTPVRVDNFIEAIKREYV